MSTVEFRNVTKRYASVTVLENLNLKVEDGEFVVLLGPSGCGKTSLLNILAGLLDFDDGEIYIGGQESPTWTRKTAASPWFFSPTRSTRPSQSAAI